MKAILVTYVYPGVEKYLKKLIDSLNEQSDKGFEVIFFNDGLENLDVYRNELNINSRSFLLSGSPNQIRFKSLQKIEELDTDIIIFQDSDDFPDFNRIEEVKKKMNTFDLVVNDLNIIDDQGGTIDEFWWSGRIENNTVFGVDFIENKNIVGLGNTSVKKYLLTQKNIKFTNTPVAFDWFLFYQIMYYYNIQGVFINTTCTNYRQHHDNLAGFRRIDRERIQKVMEVKTKHFKALSETGFEFKDALKEIEILKQNLSSYDSTKQSEKKINPFWWEEIQMI